MKKLRQTDWGVITSSLLNTLSYTVLFYSSIRRSRLAADLTFQVRWLTQSWCCLEIFVYATEFPTILQAENTSGHHLMNNLTGHFTSPHLNDALGWFGPLSSLSLPKTPMVIKLPQKDVVNGPMPMWSVFKLQTITVDGRNPARPWM